MVVSLGLIWGDSEPRKIVTMSESEDDADYYHDAQHADGMDTLEAQQVPCAIPSRY